MALPKQEAFTGVDATTLTAHDANWHNARTLGGCALLSNKLKGATNSFGNTFFWAGDAFSADQYAQVVLSAIDLVGYGGVIVRCDGTTGSNFYFSEVENGDRWIEKCAGGSFTTIFNDAGAITAGDLLRLEVSGNQLTLKRNGTTIAGPTTDNSYASGSAGVYIFEQSTTFLLDDWEGGNLAAAAAKRFLLVR